jgi:hypothetical protein
MTSLSSELEKRLRQLEQEQNSQEDALNDLSDFEIEVSRLERTLAQIDNYEFKQKPQKTDFSQLRDLKETERLERELVDIDKEDIKPQKTASSKSYVIALLFNPDTPIEWSGTRWHKKGAGMSYTLEQAKQTLNKLQKQWPNYPLKILKR